MLKNYLKTILRNTRRNRTFTAINVFGLTLGLAAFLTITQYIRFETSFDSYHPGSEQMVRLGMELNFGDGDLALPFMGSQAAVTFTNDYPEVETATRLGAELRREYFVKLGDTEFKEPAMTRLYADANFFEFFGIALIQGNPQEVLNGPNLVVITESMAQKYFGADWQSQSVIGQSISMDDHAVLQISGVSEDVPANTHFDYHFLVSGQTVKAWDDPFWFSNAIYHYLKLAPGTNVEALISKANENAPNYLAADMKQFLGSSYGDFFGVEGRYFRFSQQAISDIHLDSHFELELADNGERMYVNILTSVSVLVLLMAAINFMNLSTVSGLKRHKEVGIRKVLGSLKAQLLFQFLLESVLIVLFSMVLAVTLLQATAPFINSSFDMVIIPSLSVLLDLFLWLVGGAIVLGILSGLYPALILSGLKPVAIIKGFSSGRRGVGAFRNVLIIFQFSISLLLIIGVAGIQHQLQYLQSRDLGYDKEQVMVIEDTGVLGEQVSAFREKLVQHASINAASISGFVPIGSNEYGVGGFNSLDDDKDLTLRFKAAYVDEHYITTYGMSLLSGRDFSSDFGDESSKVIVNESFAKSWGWTDEEILGKRFENVGDKQERTVIGVIKDFQAFNMKTANEPLVLNFEQDNQAISLRFEAQNFQSAKEAAIIAWEEFTDKPFDYTMADARFESIFTNEMKANRLFVIFAALAMIIGALGLLGVASYVITSRSKEVGIRKVLGASLPQLFGTLSRNFMVLILVAGVIAIPAAWYLLSDWLSQYAFQVSLSWWLFALPLAFLGLITFFIVGMQIWKVAIINPIKSLRYE